ncbi:hypothetical protein MASR1M32_36410 [Rhodobacter sp.]
MPGPNSMVPGLGWVGFDPANRCCPDDRYIRLGSGFDARSAAPIRGIARGPAGKRRWMCAWPWWWPASSEARRAPAAHKPYGGAGWRTKTDVEKAGIGLFSRDMSG